MNRVLQGSLEQWGEDITSDLTVKIWFAVNDMFRDIQGDLVEDIGRVYVTELRAIVGVIIRGREGQVITYSLLINCPRPASANQLFKVGAWEDTIAAFVYLFLGIDPGMGAMRGKQGFRYFVGPSTTRDSSGDYIRRDYVDELLKQQRLQFEVEMGGRLTRALAAIPSFYIPGDFWSPQPPKTEAKAEPEPEKRNSPHWRLVEL